MAKHEKNSNVNTRTRSYRARNMRLIRTCILVIALAGVFLLGFEVRGNQDLLASLGFSSEITGKPSSDTNVTTKKDVYNSLSPRINEVEDLLASESLDSYDLNEATQMVLETFSVTTDDASLRYYTQERYEELLATSNQGYAGIGVLFSEYNGSAYVVDVFPGSTAELNGVQEGDFVVAVNGDRSQSWSLSEVAAAINLPADSSVVVTWRRPEAIEADGGEEFTTTLTCSTYDVKNVSTILEDEVGYIALRQITNNSASLVRDAIDGLTEQGAVSFVLDLRNNPGGYLTQAVNTASLFMESGSVVQIETRNGQSARSVSGKVATRAPLVVIVNGNTAGTAEVLAAALQESGRATIIGEKTLGKGSVQVIHPLTFGGALRYTAAYYLTPDGRDIDGAGVSPKVIVAYDKDSGEDAQFDYAIEAARSAAGN